MALMGMLSDLSGQTSHSLHTVKQPCQGTSLPCHLGIVFLSGDKNDELGSAVATAFEECGCCVYKLLVDDPWPSGLKYVVVYGPFTPMAPLIARVRLEDNNPGLVIWYTEGTPPPTWPVWLLKIVAKCMCETDDFAIHSRFGRNIFRLPILSLVQRTGTRIRLFGQIQQLQAEGRLRLLAVISPHRLQFFKRSGIITTCVPIGYDPVFGRPMNLDRDIDVTFLGSTRDRRRRRIVQELQRQVSSLGIRFVIKDGTPENGYVWGEDRAKLLNRTKIMLNIMRQPWDCPTFRIVLAAPNGAMVLSESVRDTGPFVPGKHFATASLASMVDAIQFYLHHEDLRAKIATEAYDFVVNDLKMSTLARMILDELQANP